MPAFEALVMGLWRRAPELVFRPGGKAPALAGRRPVETGIAELRRRIERHAQEISHLMQRIQSAEAENVPQVNNVENDLVAKQHG